jgi:hypothetical protein
LARCAAIKANGERCKVQAIPEAEWCWSHHPDHQEARRRRASKGGKRGGRGRPLADVRDLKARSAELEERTLSGKVKSNIAAVVNQIHNTQLRAIGLEHNIHDVETLAREFEEMRQILEARKGDRWGA